MFSCCTLYAKKIEMRPFGSAFWIPQDGILVQKLAALFFLPSHNGRFCCFFAFAFHPIHLNHPGLNL